MRQIILLVLLLVLVIPVLGTSLQHTRTQANELKISFNLPDYSIDKVMEEGSELRKLKVKGNDSEDWKENFSGLPQLESWVYIPDGFDAQISISDQSIQNHNNIDCEKLDDPADDTGWLDISEPMVFRGNRIVSFCVKPFQYNKITKQLQTLDQAELTVRFIPGADYIADERLQTPNTVNMLKSLCINREDIEPARQKPGSYVIISNGTNITNLLQPYVAWKREKGYEVNTVNTTLIGNSTTAIKAYLQNAYNTWDNPPEFVMIFGKGVSGTYYVPTYTEYYEYNTVGDYFYTLLDGNDLIPDAYIGRITFASEDELTTAVNRMISYEKMQGLSTINWLSKYFLLGDPSDSGIACITAAQYTKGLIQSYNPSALFTEAYSGSFPSQINAALNSGVGTYFYRGHGDFSNWTTTDINNLNNTGKYFFFSYITCFSGNFGSSSISQAERLTRIGTPSVPKGAIGVIAASCETHTCLNNIVTGGVAYGLYVDGMTQGGPAMVRGKLALMANYPQNPANYINQYMQQINLFGDPGLDIWMKEPTLIIVTPPSTLYSDGGNALVQVTLTDGTPVKNAWVSLYKSVTELAVNGFTDDEGWIILPYNALTNGTAKLTVTKPNHRTYQSTLTIDLNSAPLTLLPITALQQVSAGSDLSFSVLLVNNSDSTLTAVSAGLESLNEQVEITQSTSIFGEIAPDSASVSQSMFSIHVDPDTPKGSLIYFKLNVTSTQGNYSLPFYCTENGPNFSFGMISFPSNLLIHGTNNLSLTLQNTSLTPITGLQAMLESSHPLVTITNPTLDLGTVGANQTVSLPTPFQLNVADSLAEGTNIRFYLILSSPNGFMQTLSIDKKVGIPTPDDFTGPDNYGYICYGPGDDEYVPYNWIEIDPSQGGTGTLINLSDTDPEGSGSYQTITIPFQFRFYGKSYSQLTVCSNGFIMPGTQGSIEWMNWQIPGPMVPRPILAPFWDDLLTDATSRFIYKYDAVLGAEIIQWQNLKNKFSPTLRETFQVVLYDPVFHASPTGDSPILFQYKVFNNVDSGNYGVSYIDHGQYASIGIADHTGQTGLGYTFNNQYPATAQILQNLTTLYFTTLPAYNLEPELIVLNNQISELSGNGNGLADAGEVLNFSVSIKNVGLGSLAVSQVTLTSIDPYVTILQGSSILNNIGSNQTETLSPPFTIAISQNCPNHHIISFNLHIQNEFTFTDLHLEQSVNALQFMCSEGIFLDANNDFPEPGESGVVQFTIQNLSVLNAQNLVVSLTHPDLISVTNPTQTINVNAQSSILISFNLTLDSNIAQASYLDIGIHLSIPAVYDSLFTSTMLVGVPEVFLNTNFENTDIQQIFPTYYNVNINPAVAIHQDGQEAVFTCVAANPFSYAFSYPLSTNDLLTARIRFKWQSSFSGMTLALLAIYNDQPDPVTLWSKVSFDDSVKTETIYLNDFPDYAYNMTLVFMATANSYDFTQLYMDDLSILTLRPAPGFISGHINMEMYPELVDQVNLRIRFIDEVYHPDAQGNYLIPAFQGTSILTADLDGFICAVDSLVVNVSSGQTTTAPDLLMERLSAPVNLNYSLNNNALTLSWDIESLQNLSGKENPEKQNRMVLPDYYKISIRWNNFNFTASSNTQTYTNTIQLSGTYQIYVRSVFLLDGMTETYSSTSDTLFLNFTAGEEQTQIPLIYALNQNHPNPFNPTTQITFAIPEPSIVTLKVYNTKGQEVKMLTQTDLPRGIHSVTWNGLDNSGKSVSSGVYYYKLNWKGKELTRKMILLK